MDTVLMQATGRTSDPEGSRTVVLTMNKAQARTIARQLALRAGHLDVPFGLTLLLQVFAATGWFFVAESWWLLLFAVPMSLFVAMAHAGAGRR
jgi:hypothetical protein